MTHSNEPAKCGLFLWADEMALPPTLKVGPFYGINNRLPDHKMTKAERGQMVGHYLRNAVNVDLTGANTLLRRPGVERVIQGGDCHSLWSDGRIALFVDGQTLFMITDQITKVAIKTDMAPGVKVSFARVIDDIYWSNGAQIERIRNEVSAPAGVSPINPAPEVAAASGGALHEGRYQIAVTMTNAAGEESGATWPIQVLVPEGGEIEITGMGSGTKRIYMSPLNGDALHYIGTTNAAAEQITVMPQLGPQISTLGLTPMPPGQIVRWGQGRLLVASDNTLLYSPAHAPALHHPGRGYIPFPSRITVLEPFDDGIYVVADRTYWIAGQDIENPEALIERLPYGATEGTSVRDARSKRVWWFSDRGLVMAGPGGEIANVQEENVAVGKAVAGATFQRERDGMEHVISSLFDTGFSRATATSFMEAEIIRKKESM